MSRLTTDLPLPKPARTSPGARGAMGARLEARLSTVQKSMFQRAADLSGRSLSEFVVASAQDAAERLLQSQDVIRLTPAEQTAFVRGLLEDGGPGPRLRQAAANYKKRMGLR
jgi:uncharacterized protein (DUF1778 family)